MTLDVLDIIIFSSRMFEYTFI